MNFKPPKIQFMKKIILSYVFIISFSVLNAQVGIGTTNPNAQLEIAATSASAPTATDGLLIPRVTAFPTPVTISQNGMMVFLTTAFGTNQVGLYYYDFPSLTWKWMASGTNSNVWINNNSSSRVEIPKQSDGITNRPTGNEAVVLDNGNVGFGTLIPARHFQVNRDIDAGTKFAVSNPNIGTGAFSQITAEALNSTAYLYSLSSNYTFNPTFPWFSSAGTTLQATGSGGLSIVANNSVGNIKFFTDGIPGNERMRITNTGNVGIGTTTPVSPLHISGTSASVVLDRFGIGSHFIGRTANGTQLLPTALNANDIATRLSGWGHNGTGYWPVGIIDIMAEENQTTSAAGGYIKFTTTNTGGTASSEKMRITSTGNVGIGTTNPTANLEINDASGTKQELSIISDGINAHYPSIGIKRFSGASNFLGHAATILSLAGGTSSTPLVAPANNTVAAFLGTAFSNGSFKEIGRLNFSTSSTFSNTDTSTNFNLNLNNGVSNSTRLTILSNGNTGIDNVAPTEKLDVAGNIKLLGALMPNNLAGTSGDILTSAGAGVAPTWATTSTLLANEWHLTGNTNTTPGANFIGTLDNKDLVFKTNNTEKMRILDNGNVGIGIINPLEKLHIAGKVLLTDSFGAPSQGSLTYTSNTGRMFIGPTTGTSLNGGGIALRGASNTASGFNGGSITMAVPGGFNGYDVLIDGLNGNVGIGGIIPAYKLQVKGDIASTDGLIPRSTYLTGSSATTVYSDNIEPWADNGIKLYDGNTNAHIHLEASNIGEIQSYSPLGSIKGQLENTNTSNLVLQNKGSNVGIGINNPLEKLHVAGKLLLTNGFGNPTAGSLNYTNDTGRMFIGPASGTSTNGGVIAIRGATNTASGINGGTITMGTPGGSSTGYDLLIDGLNGNVGIGGIIPTEKLDVGGNLKVSGAIMPNNIAGTNGQVLTSAGVGVAPTWNNPSSQMLNYATTGATTGIYSVTLSQYTIRVFNLVSEIKLPTPVGNNGKIFIIIGSNGISPKTWSTLGGVIYDDVTNTTYTTISGSQRFMVQSDGTDWIVIGR
jgi:hypothetical protein